MDLGVIWCSYQKLSCMKCVPSDVVLCLKDTAAPKLAPTECDPYSYDPYAAVTLTTLDAVLASWTCKVVNGVKQYKYTFSYNSDLLYNEELIIEASDISGVICDGCFVQWVRDQAGNEISVEQYGNIVTITSQHGCIYEIDVSGETPATCEEVLACIHVDPYTIEGDGSPEYPLTVTCCNGGGGVSRDEGLEYFNDFLDIPPMSTFGSEYIQSLVYPYGGEGIHGYVVGDALFNTPDQHGNGIGVFSFESTNPDDIASLFSNFNAGVMPLVGDYTIEWRAAADLGGVGENVVVIVGLANLTTEGFPFPTYDPPGGVYFLYTTSNDPDGASAETYWQTVSVSSAGTRTFNQNHTEVTVDTDFHKFRVDVDNTAGEAYYYIDDVLIATHDTNLPDGTNPIEGLAMYALQYKIDGSSSKYLDLDYVYLRQIFDSPR